MTIKELAYSAQQRLQSSTGCSFKRAHIYELLASSFGFKSYAALCSDHIFTQRLKTTAISEQRQLLLWKRVVELGYEQKIADTTASVFVSLLNEHRIDVVGVSDLIRVLKPDYLEDGAELEDELNLEDSISEELWSNRYSSEYPPILLETLEAKASKGDHRAHYVLALIYKPDGDDEYANGGGGYWHSQEQQGHVLNGIKKEWADEYAKRLEESEKYSFHLREADRLGNTSTARDLAELAEEQGRDEEARHWLTVAAQAGDTFAMHRLADYFESSGDKYSSEEGSKYWHSQQQQGHKLTDVQKKWANGYARQLEESEGRNMGVVHWLTVAAEAGDVDAIRRLIDNYEDSDLQQSWMWLYLAEKLGTDLTESHTYAINENGDPVDGDYSGAIFAAGDEGVELMPLDDERKREAKNLADALFLKIQQSI